MKEHEDWFIERLNQKQRGAFHELFREYYRSLVLFAMRYIREQSVAEDIVQDLFVAVWEKQDKFVSYAGFRVFLYHSVRNTCLNTIKHQKVEEKYFHYSQYHSEQYDDESAVTEEEIFRKLFSLVDDLPARCRQVFLLHLDGKKNEEIARELHITVLTVKTQKKKAVNYLRQRMGRLVMLLLWL